MKRACVTDGMLGDLVATDVSTTPADPGPAAFGAGAGAWLESSVEMRRLAPADDGEVERYCEIVRAAARQARAEQPATTAQQMLPPPPDRKELTYLPPTIAGPAPRWYLVVEVVVGDDEPVEQPLVSSAVVVELLADQDVWSREGIADNKMRKL